MQPGADAAAKSVRRRRQPPRGPADPREAPAIKPNYLTAELDKLNIKDLGDLDAQLAANQSVLDRIFGSGGAINASDATLTIRP